MKVIFTLALMFGACTFGHSDEPKMIPVIEQDGTTYVAGTALARDAAIAIKKLPGNDIVVACSSERCAQLKDFLKKGDELWVSTASLTRALGLSARFTDDKRQVRFDVVAQKPSASDPTAGVGQLAPDFLLPKLEGGTVSLADFRGKRVLIESWASW
jgi:hypothetical protein